MAQPQPPMQLDRQPTIVQDAALVQLVAEVVHTTPKQATQLLAVLPNIKQIAPSIEDPKNLELYKKVGCSFANSTRFSVNIPEPGGDAALKSYTSTAPPRERDCCQISCEQETRRLANSPPRAVEHGACSPTSAGPFERNRDADAVCHQQQDS